MSRIAGPIPRQNAFDLLRLVAALAVLLQHSNAYLSTNVGWGVSGLVDGVAVFFVLSGFLVYSSASNLAARGLGWRTFFRNRYLRIAPALAAFAVIAPLVVVGVGAVSFSALLSPQLIVWFGSFAFLVPNYHPGVFDPLGSLAINGPLYTIPAECSFYLVVPVLVVAARRFGFARTIAVFLAVSVVGGYFANTGGDRVFTILHHTFLERGAYFAAGVILAEYAPRIPLSRWLACLAGIVYLVLIVFGKTEPFVAVYGPFKPVLVAGPLAYLVFYAGLRLPRAASRITSRIGDLSYGTYVWHTLFIAVLVFAGASGHAWATGAVLVLSLSVAALSWFLVEKPSLRLKRASMRPAVAAPPVDSGRRRA